jgi:hypothetical protein
MNAMQRVGDGCRRDLRWADKASVKYGVVYEMIIVYHQFETNETVQERENGIRYRIINLYVY